MARWEYCKVTIDSSGFSMKYVAYITHFTPDGEGANKLIRLRRA